jgi:hypothetical protein
MGASRDLGRLQTLKIEDLEKLPGCNMIVEWTGNSFKGYVEPGKACMVFRKGKNTYLSSSFEIDQDKFISLDQGRDPETDDKFGARLLDHLTLYVGRVLLMK